MSTNLRVTAHSSSLITGCTYCYASWFITFDGTKCSPIPINGIAYHGANEDVVRPHVFTGFCNIKKTGSVNVALNVGTCTTQLPIRLEMHSQDCNHQQESLLKRFNHLKHKIYST